MYQRLGAILLLGEGRWGAGARLQNRPAQRRGPACSVRFPGPMNTGQIRSLTYRAQHSADAPGGIMHPMFVKLFLETDADDLLTVEEARRRSARRSRRNRPVMAVKAVPRDRSRPPQR
jgi:hypothetical protein